MVYPDSLVNLPGLDRFDEYAKVNPPPQINARGPLGAQCPNKCRTPNRWKGGSNKRTPTFFIENKGKLRKGAPNNCTPLRTQTLVPISAHPVHLFGEGGLVSFRRSVVPFNGTEMPGNANLSWRCLSGAVAVGLLFLFFYCGAFYVLLFCPCTCLPQ